jgi:hypothetical protein
MSSSSLSSSSDSNTLVDSFHKNNFNLYEPYACEALADSSEHEVNNKVDLVESTIQTRFEGIK